jgi:alanine racemase
MIRSRHVTVRVDLSVVRSNAEAVARLAGVPLIAVVKADAYGLGAREVARAVADLVDGFYVFDLAEAVAFDLAATGKRTIALRAESDDPADYLAHRLQPAVWDAATAATLRTAKPVLSVDTGQQRFGVPVEDAATIDAILRAGDVDEAFTHATTIAQAAKLIAKLRGKVTRLHAAGSALIGDPAAALDAVRPGLALYRGAVRALAPLIDVRDSAGPAGYTGFSVARHGLILAGYSNGLRPGPCRVNGRPSRILEVGMQSAFVECEPADRAGDPVVLLGDGLTEQEVASAWQASEQEVIGQMAGLGERRYVEP